MFWQTVELVVLSAIFSYRLVYINKCIIIRHLRNDIVFGNCACTYQVIVFPIMWLLPTK